MTPGAGVSASILAASASDLDRRVVRHRVWSAGEHPFTPRPRSGRGVISSLERGLSGEAFHDGSSCARWRRRTERADRGGARRCHPMATEAHRSRSQRSRSRRWTMPRTRMIRSSVMTSYMTRNSPTRSRWKESGAPLIDLTALPPTSPRVATSSASRSSAWRTRVRGAGARLSKTRAAAVASLTS